PAEPDGDAALGDRRVEVVDRVDRDRAAGRDRGRADGGVGPDARPAEAARQVGLAGVVVGEAAGAVQPLVDHGGHPVLGVGGGVGVLRGRGAAAQRAGGVAAGLRAAAGGVLVGVALVGGGAAAVVQRVGPGGVVAGVVAV